MVQQKDLMGKIPYKTSARHVQRQKPYLPSIFVSKNVQLRERRHYMQLTLRNYNITDLHFLQ